MCRFNLTINKLLALVKTIQFNELHTSLKRTNFKEMILFAVFSILIIPKIECTMIKTVQIIMSY